MSPPPSIPSAEPTILFRPSKKRKIYRQRATSQEPDVPTPSAPEAQSLDELISSTAQEAEVEGVQVPMSEILRLRKQRKGKGGVVFGVDSSSRADREEGRELAIRAPEEEKAEEGLESNGGVVRKFAPQTGTIGDVDRHMMAYIDSELAKRRISEGSQPSAAAGSISSSIERATINSNKTGEVNRQPAALGKILEVDLGDEVRSKNVARTNRLLNGEEVEDGVQRKPAKVRLGRDGKPWRGRKRRGSDDIARDKIVEDLLRENRLEIYEETPTPPPNSNGDQAADDALADAFLKDYMDSVKSRQPRVPQVASTAKTAQAKKEEEALKGPKLGGSRNARAAMREQMLKDASKKR
ncbi:hypothetical protein GLAREA_00359 [Glarea lozoyensis ATCC 20868]|uniref:mRNA splicing factor RNA helicase n=1 Tax=Glarea lozoyensis (strain ATCC 20868 / MF5171) TaxID=1116229 RepID=S3CW92_GLAL2|nr:uncharacterized protein GLAREA_00359 [Glarea lozoyensis ATCC 20868]EPE29199.1 hypothetical protein GLAREA_00359 [Glarea lozoyensis ATCC 20868]